MTPQRYRRLCEVLARRQPDLTVLMDNVHKRHNFSAVLRSCDAVGVLEAHGVWPHPQLRPAGGVSAGTGKWLRIVTHEDIPSAFAALRRCGMRLVVAHHAADARDYREVDFTAPTAIVLGAELEGVSARARELADDQVMIPMLGMADSLNVSVAAAILLFEAQRQRLTAGMYDRPRLEPARRRAILFEWAHPQVAQYCRRHGLEYPQLDADGGIRDPIPTP